MTIKRWRALSSVSFHVEFVSFSAGSFCSNLSANLSANTEPTLEPRDQSLSVACFDANFSNCDYAFVLRRTQSTSDVPTVDALPENSNGILRTTNEKSGTARDTTRRRLRRHSVDCCDKRDLQKAAGKVFRLTEMSKGASSNAFQTSRYKTRRLSRRTVRIRSFKKFTKSFQTQLDGNRCSLIHNKKYTLLKSIANKIPPHVRDLKQSRLERDPKIEQNGLPQFKGSDEDTTNNDNNKDGFADTMSSLDTFRDIEIRKESTMKRLISKLLKCICSDDQTIEREVKT
eukprot:g5268.t1